MAKGPVAPQVVSPTIRQCWVKKMKQAIESENLIRLGKGKRLVGPDMTRMLFHDCGPGSCDGSVLLNAEEIASSKNRNLEGATLVRKLKDSVSSCGKNISWADTIVLSSAIGITNAGGPSMENDIFLGRGDYAGKNNVDLLPTADLETADLVTHFASMFGCSAEIAIKHLVTLSGAHTFGDATCDTFTARRFSKIPDGNITAKLLKSMAKQCPIESCSKANFDITSPKKFDNGYFKNLIVSEGLLFTDQVIYTHDIKAGAASTRALVRKFAADEVAFRAAWRVSYTAMTNIGLIKVK
eukprot:TRINITY_DN1189_c0_g2_i1.p1 TRINITY_DN1189_c0_g2~~TRINITY_DN1189_c0_g2_i1.p1  ORF type:complete len:339 (-),score=55.22 TRINITY_DN1189_c0_g2_i1:399-1289(-)